jgi:hypothetical protein
METVPSGDAASAAGPALDVVHPAMSGAVAMAMASARKWGRRGSLGMRIDPVENRRGE